jgi:putative ABC transport system permease protein
MRDIRYALRMLGRSKGFTLAAVLCLALGIGATTAIFTVVNAVLLRPLPYERPDRLARIYTEFPTFPNGGLRRFWTSAPEFLTLRQELQSYQSVDAWATGGANVGGGAEPARVSATQVSGGLLPTLGVNPLRGRLLTAQDDTPESPAVAVISYGLWQRVFGGDPSLLSRDIRLNGVPTTVVGIMPQGFQFPPGEVDPPEVWSPLRINPASPGNRGGHFLYLLGRLRDGTSHEQAQQELQQIVNAHHEFDTPGVHEFNKQHHTLLGFPLHDEVVGSVRPAMLMMLAAVVFVLLIACGNVANLLLARAEGRQREISIRTAMGAHTAALVRQFLWEGIVLSLAGAALGLVFAVVGLDLIVDLNAGSIPRADEIGIDWRVLVFTLVVSIATGVLFGMAPMLHRFGKTTAEALKAASGKTTASVEANHFRRLMVAGELALALVLLIGAGLMVRGFWKLQAVDIGMRTDQVLTLRVALPSAVYPENQRTLQFWENLLPRLNQLPNVTAATLLSGTPPVRPLNANDVDVEGFVKREGGPIENFDFFQVVGDRFGEATGARLIEGRFVNERDGANAPSVLMVNYTLARTFWPGESAIGKRMRLNDKDPWRTIVGVVGDVKNAGIDKPAGAEAFFPFRQAGGFGLRNAALFIRTAGGDPRAVLAGVRRELAAIDGSLPIAQVRTFDEITAAAQSRPRFLAALLTLFSAVALTLAALGIYGVMSYVVAQRTNEFGVRMAIGAQQSHVLGLVLKQGMLLGVVGIAAGAAGAIGLTRFLKGMLYGVDTFDPLTFLSMAAALLAVILLACYLPARRATRIDPMTALRYE